MKHRPLAKKVATYSHTGARIVQYVNAESNVDAANIARKQYVVTTVPASLSN